MRQNYQTKPNHRTVAGDVDADGRQSWAAELSCLQRHAASVGRQRRGRRAAAPSVTLTLSPNFEPSADGRTRTVEAAATVNGLTRQGLQCVDGLGSGTVAQSSDDDETQRRLTEEQRQPRERTDAADLGDYRDEGRVAGGRYESDGSDRRGAE
jgi:hypothetical protein